MWTSVEPLHGGYRGAAAHPEVQRLRMLARQTAVRAFQEGAVL